MKIRQGFVSNSSSSSFVVLLPEDFKFESIDIDSLPIEFYDFESKENINRDFNTLMREKKINRYNSETVKALGEILEDFVLGTFEAGSDDGAMILLDNNKIKNILKKEME